MTTENNKPDSSPPDSRAKNTALRHLFSSEKLKNYLKSLSKINGFDLSIYDENGTLLLTTGQNPLCNIFRALTDNGMDCPAYCERFMFEPIKLNEPLIYKCSAKIMNFSVPITYLNEKAVITGRNGFSSYEDFLEFFTITKEKCLKEIPITKPLNFVDEICFRNIAQYIYTVMNYLLNNLQEKHRLTEKLARFTSLVDINILAKLSNNTNAINRYIIDTIEFILGPTSVATLILDSKTLTYKAVSVSGKKKDLLLGIRLDSADTLIQQIVVTRSPVFTSEFETARITPKGTAGETDLLHLFPIFIDNTLEGLIAILDRKLPEEDVRIIKAFSDYIEVTLENHALHLALDKKLEEVLVSMSDLSRSIAPLLNSGQLLQTIVAKSTQFLKAEQGSLMLLNNETSELIVEAKKGLEGIEKADMRSSREEGIAWKVLESGKPLLVTDVEKDPRINQKNKPRYKTKSFLSIPIKIEDRVAGVLNMVDKITGDIFNENDLKLLQSFIPNAAIAIERSFLYKKSEELKKQSLTDPLTGTLNRRYLNNRLAEEISRFRRYKHSFSLLMLDIDGFKNYNDTFGHITGDKLLKSLAASIISSLRNIDVVARFGGDEFVIILPQTPKADAITIANRVKENIEKSNITGQHGLPPDNLTVSMGLSSYPDDASSPSELFEKTDQALFLAKKGGRNKLVYL